MENCTLLLKMCNLGAKLAQTLRFAIPTLQNALVRCTFLGKYTKTYDTNMYLCGKSITKQLKIMKQSPKFKQVREIISVVLAVCTTCALLHLYTPIMGVYGILFAVASGLSVYEIVTPNK